MSTISTRHGHHRFSWVTAAAVTTLSVVACGGSTASPSAGSGEDATDAGGAGSNNGPTTGPSTPGNPGVTPTGDAGGVTPHPREAGASACPATGSEVVMLGDSYPALSGEIGKQLQSLATAAGALDTGDAYRTYYVSGTNMVGGRSPNIPTQFANAVTANGDIKYVIMDGGGNDILLGNTSCITQQAPPGNTSCVATINAAVAAATTLFAQMKTDGVQKVVYYFYPHLPTTGKPYVNDTLDYAAPLVKAACDGAPLPCYFVDPRPAFEGHPEYIGADGIHPTVAGSDVIAGLIWGVMQTECVAQ